MDNSNNNIRLEIELTNRERGDSIIRDDIETALEIHIKKNETIKEKEIDKCVKYEWTIKIVLGILGFSLIIGIVYLIGYGLINFIQSLINY